MINPRLGNDFFQTSQQPRISSLSLFLLARFVILTSVDEVIKVAMSIDTHVIVRIPGIPEKRFGQGSGGDSSTERVARIERELCLEKCRGGDTGQAHKWIVCCHHHAIETDPIAVDLNAALLCVELARRALLENVRAVARNFLNQ